MQVGQPIELTAGEPILLTTWFWNGGGPGFARVGVRMPGDGTGKPTWNSVPQKQAISWAADYHGLLWRLAISWTRRNQTTATVSVTGSPEDLSNPRNGVQIAAGTDKAAFSVAANETWIESLSRAVLRRGSGAAHANARNTDVKVLGSPETGNVTFLFVADTDVNADLTGDDTGLSVQLVRPCKIPDFSNLLCDC